ncbi:hypothetical protein Aperf_G00000046074 [Anoplocephala perfoliata]
MRSSSSSIEKFQLPAIWNNEDEVYRLFVEIKRPRHMDPAGYDYKISFWRDLIISYTKSHRIVVITEQSLTDVFKRCFDSDGVVYKPRCLHQVLSEMMDSGLVKVVKQETLVNSLVNFGFEWIIKKPASWVWSYVKGEEEIKNDLDRRSYGTPDTPLYLAESIDPLCEDFLEECKKTQDSLIVDGHVYPLEDFDEALAKYIQHINSRDLIKNQLCERGFIRVDRSASIPVMKILFIICFIKLVFLCDGKPVNLDPTTLSSIAHLRKTMKEITQDQERLENEISIRRERVKVLARSNRKYDALSLLRRCKQLENELDRKAQHLTQLEALELKICAAKDNKTVLNAMSEAKTALKQTTGGLPGLEDAEKTMDDMAEAMEDLAAVSQAISTPLDSLSRNPDEEKNLSAELDDLMAEESEEPPKKDSINKKLPSPPQHEIELPINPKVYLAYTKY